jgi:hypothetical protein
VGKNEPNHTAQQQLYPILKDDRNNPSIEDLEKAFEIESVTKQFYKDYRQLFLGLTDELQCVIDESDKVKKEFETKSIDTTNFSKKLLGQVIFLYFLQKKGWFGVDRDADWGTGPRDFLRDLLGKQMAEGKNFFNDSLEALFYEALAGERPDDFYSKFNCKIPFLNGGLFDPINDYDWVHTDMLLSNDLFSNNRKTKDGDIGTGILDVFDRYNFTVKEDEPLDKEVAIDPEMLGKIFEKLGAINDKNFDEWKKAVKSSKKSEEMKFNKKHGAYYTPREIVHCRIFACGAT